MKSFPILVAGMVAIVGIFAAVAILGWNAGFFHAARTPAAGTVVAATVAAVATFMTATFSLVAAFLKHSADLRTEERLRVEAVRNDLVARDAERRLKLEAAIQAVELLGDGKGGVSAPLQQAGALCALATLGHYALALALLRQIHGSGAVMPSAASQIVSQAITSGDGSVRIEAVKLFAASSKLFLSDDGCDIPDAMHRGGHELSSDGRYWATLGLGRLLLARPYVEWRKPSLGAVIGSLVMLWQTEDDARFKDSVGAVLSAALSALPRVVTIMHVHAGALDVAPVRTLTRELVAEGVAAIDVVQRLEAWREERDAPPKSTTA